MTTATSDRLVLELPPRAAFLPVAAAAAENAALAFGLAQAEALRLGLAVEEYFTYLCHHAGREEPLRLTLSQGGTFVRASFRFRAGAVSLRALNFTAHIDVEGEHAGELGLLVASRTTDRSSLELSGADVYQLCAEVDREYPRGEPIAAIQRLAPPLRVEDAPGSGLLQHCALLAAGRYAPRLCPSSFSHPGRFADMAASGQYRALVALDSAERPAGLFCWRASGQHGVAFSGPYVFCAPGETELAAETAKLLTERFLSLVARSPAVCAFSERPTTELPRGWFERLGTLSMPDRSADGVALTPQPAYVRHLREDVGGAVWTSPGCADFLRREYDRLAFSRDLLPATPTPQATLPEHSLLATSLDRVRGLVLLRPLLDGRDFPANLAAHVQALREAAADAPMAILLHLDLSQPWQAALFPALTGNGFEPRLVLPHGGTSDILVCQHAAAHR